MYVRCADNTAGKVNTCDWTPDHRKNIIFNVPPAQWVYEVCAFIPLCGGTYVFLATNQTRHAVAVHMYLGHSVATTQHEENCGVHCKHASVTSNIVWHDQWHPPGWSNFITALRGRSSCFNFCTKYRVILDCVQGEGNERSEAYPPITCPCLKPDTPEDIQIFNYSTGFKGGIRLVFLPTESVLTRQRQENGKQTSKSSAELERKRRDQRQ